MSDCLKLKPELKDIPGAEEWIVEVSNAIFSDDAFNKGFVDIMVNGSSLEIKRLEDDDVKVGLL